MPDTFQLPASDALRTVCRYSPGWLQNDDASPSSVSLPKRVEPFSRRECRPFFGGLLPEESQRHAAAQALGVSRGNDFALLDRLGGDIAGALQLASPDETPAAPDPDQRPIPFEDAGLIRVMDKANVRVVRLPHAAPSA